MSNAYGDGGFYFLKPVGAGPGYPGSGSGYGELAVNGQVYEGGKDYSGYGELAFDGQVYTDGKDYPMQGALRRGYGEDSDYSGPNDYRFISTVKGPERVLDCDRLALTAVNYRRVQSLYAIWSNKVIETKRIMDALPSFGRAVVEKEFQTRVQVRNYYASCLRRWSAPQPQQQRSAPPVVRQGFYQSQQPIPGDLREALLRLMARRGQARTQAELRALQAEIARLQQLMTAQQVASVQQTAPAVTQYAPSPTVSAAPDINISYTPGPSYAPGPSMVPEGAMQPMISAEDMEAKKVGLDAAAGAAAEEPSFIEKYGLFLGIAAVAAGGYYYMNRKEQAAV